MTRKQSWQIVMASSFRTPALTHKFVRYVIYKTHKTTVYSPRSYKLCKNVSLKKNKKPKSYALKSSNTQVLARQSYSTKIKFSIVIAYLDTHILTSCYLQSKSDPLLTAVYMLYNLVLLVRGSLVRTKIACLGCLAARTFGQFGDPRVWKDHYR